MSDGKTKTLKCAVYTRKSSEEGLEQEFNTLDAQREACEAYALSQRASGWKVLSEKYDDGGFSGGNMARPGLKQLIADIEAGKVDVVVVYKIDRLTRSLMDFSKLVEIFDAHDVTFVSVTQSFNTTTSMGRLTLNVLLSFAQFEREVTGERIRDKIAASKKKGMWMGGAVPTGYKAKERTLEVVPEEARLVQHIFAEYLKYGSVKMLAHSLEAQGYKTSVRTTGAGNRTGGRLFSRGNLYSILNNPIYIGKIAHRSKLYGGLHEALITQDVWDKTQACLKGQTVSTTQKAPNNYLLQGKLLDCDGTTFTPTYCKKKRKNGGHQYYCYYTSQNLLQYRKQKHPKGVMARLPAYEVECLVTEAIKRHVRKALETTTSKNSDGTHMNHESITYVLHNMDCLTNEDITQFLIRQVVVGEGCFTVSLIEGGFEKLISSALNVSIKCKLVDTDQPIEVAYRTDSAHHGTVILESKDTINKKNLSSLEPAALKRLVQGIAWRDAHFAGESMKAIADREGCSESYVRHTVAKGFDTLKGLSSHTSSIN